MKSFPKLEWYEWLWSALPLLLGIPGGLLGAVIGAAGFGLNVYRFASVDPRPLKWMVSALINVAAAIVYLVAATVLDLLGVA